MTEGKIIKFKPFDEAADIICQNTKSYIENLKEIGEYIQIVEWTKILNGIRQNGTSEYEDDITGFIVDSFEAVCGNPYKYLGEDGVKFFDAVCEYYDPSYVDRIIINRI